MSQLNDAIFWQDWYKIWSDINLQFWSFYKTFVMQIAKDHGKTYIAFYKIALCVLLLR
jgi:hypothetical protein